MNALTVARPADAVSLLEAVRAWLGADGEFFEAVVGCPIARYGPRLTLTAPADAPDRGHPWGPPTWVRLRVGDDGAVTSKPYHRMRRLGDRFRLPAGLVGDVRPVMAAWHGDTKELYLRSTQAERWSAFAARIAALIGAEPPACAPLPGPSEGSFAFSLRWTGDELAAVSMFADDRSLPIDDDEIARVWRDGMEPGDEAAYTAAYEGVCAFAPSPTRARHGMLGWTIEANGQSHRAASLRVLHRRDVQPST